MTKSIQLRIVLLIALTALAVLRWPTSSQATGVGSLSLMPAISTGGGSLAEEGLHYDEIGGSGFGGYDYAANVGTSAYLRAYAEGDQPFPTRFKYWKDSKCKTTGRLQLYISGTWYDYWQYDVHILDVLSSVSSVSYTQTVTYGGDWLYAIVGTVAPSVDCPPNTGGHAHLSANNTNGGWWAWHPKSIDTCWSDATTCDTVMSMWKRLHQTCSAWNGWTQNRSGTISQYICESWSVMYRDDQTPAFKKN